MITVITSFGNFNLTFHSIILGDLVHWLTQGSEDCSYLLNKRERKVVKELDAAFRSTFRGEPGESPDLSYFFGDNPAFSKTWSATSGRLPCFRRNGGFYYHRKTGRIMTAVDKLTALGWPTVQEVSDNMMTTCVPLLDPKRGELMAGNAMLLGNAGIVLLVGLTCFKKKCQTNRMTGTICLPVAQGPSRDEMTTIYNNIQILKQVSNNI